MNNRSAALIGVLLTALCWPGFGQKIKYKDLFTLLNAKQYAESEKYLKKYLKENDDNPNAYLFMGLIYEDKASKLDLLKQTEEYSKNADSAVYFFELAKKGMTEKEISKNEEYYQLYNRRDLRTGKFGVTLSDVQLDLENKIKAKERNKQIKTMKAQLLAAEKSYIRASFLFRELQKAYADQKQLFLRADAAVIGKLNHLAMVADSSHISFNDYKASSLSIGKTGYNQDLDPMEISDFKKDGLTDADFYKDDLKVWDYKRWALSSVETIEKEILPLKEQLVARDMEINKLQQKLKTDSVSVKQELAALRAKGFPELKKIDSAPLPLNVFAMKEAELEFGSQIVEDKPLKDSTNVEVQMNAIRRQLLLAKKIDSVASIMVDSNLDEAAANYQHFVTTAYGTPLVLSSLIKSTKEFAIREMHKRDEYLKKKMESLRWITDGQDSVPLFSETLAIGKYKPLILVPEKYTAGVKYADTVGTGYFYLVNPSRKPSVKAAYTVDNQAFKKRNIPVTKALSTQDEKGLVYFVVTYLETKLKDKYPSTITKIYRAEGLAWSVNYGFDQLPSELVFSIETSELLVKTKSSIGEIFVVTFDRNGKAVKQQ